MNNVELYYPVLTLIIFTAAIMCWLLITRISAMKKREVSPKFFKTHDNGECLPEMAMQVTKNFTNLQEAPIIFYALCAFSIVLNKLDTMQVYLAWGFVISRMLHSIVHITVNHVNSRFMIFGISWVFLIVLAVRIAL